jgi:hypothetical protein
MLLKVVFNVKQNKSVNKYLFYKPTSVSLPIVVGKEESFGIYLLIYRDMSLNFTFRP